MAKGARVRCRGRTRRSITRSMPSIRAGRTSWAVTRPARDFCAALCGMAASTGSIAMRGMPATRRISRNGCRPMARRCRLPGSHLPSRSVSKSQAACSIRRWGVDELAWRRRRHDQHGYSAVGITHTIVSGAVMEVIANWLIAPVQPWDAVICTSKAVRDAVDTVIEANIAYLEARLGGPVRPSLPQLPIIPLGVDCNAYQPSAGVRAEWRRRLGIADQDVAVLFLGRLSFHGKAHPLPMYRGLQQALAQKPLPQGARLHLIQAGWFANDAIERAFRDGAKLHCPDVGCHFLGGRQPDVRNRIWHAADIYTSLSDNLQETFGLSPIEGMAAGLPAVVSDWDGYRDTVRDGIDGFRVPT